MFPLSTINFKQWIEENRHLLKPPVGNRQIWVGEDRDFMVTVVGGPNARKDFHVDHSEEFFYQIEGDMVLRVVENGKIRDLEIKEGEIFLLPPLVPHSPQRKANTIGLVIERKRRTEELDGLQWYCESCHHLVYEEYFYLTDLTPQLQPVFEKFYGDETLRTCKHCGAIIEPPAMYQKN